MAIISVLSLIIIAAIQTSRRMSMETAVKSEMRDIRAQMEAFNIKYGQLPPMGDCYNFGTNPPGIGSWLLALNAMRDKGLITQTTVNEWSYDPWGNPYGYDDNFGQTGSTQSLFCSVGPNGLIGATGTGIGTGDDICNHIRHEAACLPDLRCSP